MNTTKIQLRYTEDEYIKPPHGFCPGCGASIPQQWQPGLHPETYANQSRRDGIPAHQIDVFGWSLRQLDKLDIPQDDLNLILGGNAVRIFRLEDKMPHTRLFKQYLRPR